MVRKRSCPAVSHWEGGQRDSWVGCHATYDLQLDALAIELDCPDLAVAVSSRRTDGRPALAYAQVDTDGGDERRGPRVVAEAEEKTRFADAWSPGSEHDDTTRECMADSPESPISRSLMRLRGLVRERDGGERTSRSEGRP